MHSNVRTIPDSNICPPHFGQSECSIRTRLETSEMRMFGMMIPLAFNAGNGSLIGWFER